ncbi:Ig-like domain-containing protein [candidate division KSB1 bacterium]|nr:Ig-like domain-containing protein [candidate division KSB1 bacterium]
MHRRHLLAVYCVCLFLLAACARQAPPPGGPVDKTPPRILSTSPRSDSTGIAQHTRIQILFSESVDKKSVQESIFITPLSPEGVTYKWHGKRLEINFPQGLLPDRTYVITIGTGAKDRRNNPMTDSYAFAFSTGDSLDRGAIGGRLYGEIKIEGIQVWAYDLNATPDPDPSQTAPLYVTQASANGDFVLSYMALGLYRIFAVDDRDLNSRYDAEREALGITAKDYELSFHQPRSSGISLRLALRDTTRPQLSEIRSTDQRHLILRFSEKMAADKISLKNNYEIYAGPDTLEILDCFIDHRNSGFVHLLTSAQTAGKSYQLRLKNGFDLAMNTMQADACTLSFTGNGEPDSIRPYIIQSAPKDRANFFAVDSTLELFFSESMDTLSVERAVVLMDTGKTAVSGRFIWSNGAHGIFAPDQSLVPMMNYTLQAVVDSIFDRSGNPLADTSLVIRFKTMNPDTLSEISGALQDADSTAKGDFFLHARSASGAQYDLVLDAVGPYTFTKLLPSTYTLEVFRDEDHNGRYTLGEPFPFSPAERFYVYPDTISVRSRWPNEGNDIILPK